MAEWVQDGYQVAVPLDNLVNPVTAASNGVYVIRGGSYAGTDAESLAYWRGFAKSDAEKNGSNAASAPVMGFRCARTLP